MRLSMILILFLTTHKFPIDTYLCTSFKECILVCILCFQQDFPCTRLKNHAKLRILFHKPTRGSEGEEMLLYYARALLLQKRLLRQDLHKVVDSGSKFSNPDNWNHSVSLCAWSWRKRTWDKRREDEKTLRWEKSSW